MKRAFASGAAALLLGVSAGALAADTSWDQASISWIVAGDLEDNDLEGYRFDFTKSLGDTFFVRAAADLREWDNMSGDVSASRFGVGVRYPISTGTAPVELWGSLNYERLAAGVTAYGPGIDIGVRSQVTPELDLNLAFKVLGDIEDDDGDEFDYTGYEVSAAYRLQRDVSLLISYGSYELEDGGGDTEKLSGILSVGVRFHY